MGLMLNWNSTQTLWKSCSMWFWKISIEHLILDHGDCSTVMTSNTPLQINLHVTWLGLIFSKLFTMRKMCKKLKFRSDYWISVDGIYEQGIGHSMLWISELGAVGSCWGQCRMVMADNNILSILFVLLHWTLDNNLIGTAHSLHKPLLMLETSSRVTLALCTIFLSANF